MSITIKRMSAEEAQDYYARLVSQDRMATSQANTAVRQAMFQPSMWLRQLGMLSQWGLTTSWRIAVATLMLIGLLVLASAWQLQGTGPAVLKMTDMSSEGIIMLAQLSLYVTIVAHVFLMPVSARFRPASPFTAIWKKTYDDSKQASRHAG